MSLVKFLKLFLTLQGRDVGLWKNVRPLNLNVAVLKNVVF
jgi:hypothetical protein